MEKDKFSQCKLWRYKETRGTKTEKTVRLVIEKDKFSQCKLWQYKETRGTKTIHFQRDGL